MAAILACAGLGGIEKAQLALKLLVFFCIDRAYYVIF